MRVSCKRNLNGITNWREMLSALASQFDSLGILAPCLLGGKLIRVENFEINNALKVTKKIQLGHRSYPY